MSALEAYALFGAPLMMFATGMIVYYFATRETDEDRSSTK